MNENLPATFGQHLQTRYGTLSAPPGDRDLIATFLRRDGEWAFLEVEFVARCLPPKARILDIGAYLGTFTMGAALVADISFACVVDGNPAIVPYLAKNVAMHLRCPHEVIHAVVVDPMYPIGSGHAEPDNEGSTSFSGRADGVVAASASSVTIGFEALIKRFDAFDLIKADVEGMEEQLLASFPSLIRASAPLIWVECNEKPEALSLARLLLETGRPLSYFAWPSHNPANHLGNADPILPFAYEAGLLLGAEPPDLNESQRFAGCVLRRIRSIEDLKEGLWQTPRWAPREWLALNRHEMSGIAAHLLLGQKYETFLGGTSVPADHAQSEAERDARLAQHKIRQLESKLAELTVSLREAEMSAARLAEERDKASAEVVSNTPAFAPVIEEATSMWRRLGRSLSKLMARS